MKIYKINELHGESYNEALRNIADIINSHISPLQKKFVARDYVALEDIAKRFGIKFDENGEIIR